MAKWKNKKTLWKLAGAGIGALVIVFATVLAVTAPSENLRMAATQAVGGGDGVPLPYYSIDFDTHGGDCLTMGGTWDGTTSTCSLNSELVFNIPVELNKVNLECNGATFDFTYSELQPTAAIFTRIGLETTGSGVFNCNIKLNSGTGIDINNDGKPLEFLQANEIVGNTVTGGNRGLAIGPTDATFIQNNNFNTNGEGIFISPYATRLVIQNNNLCSTGVDLQSESAMTSHGFQYDPSSDHNHGEELAPEGQIYQDASAVPPAHFEFGCAVIPPTQDYIIDQADLPFTANLSGDYIVNEDLWVTDGNTSAIITFSETADNSTLNVQGKTISNANGTGIEINASNVLVKNGNFTNNINSAIKVNGPSDGVTIEANHFSENSNYLAVGGTATDLTFVRNIIEEVETVDLSLGTLVSPNFGIETEVGNYFSSDDQAKELYGSEMQIADDFNADGYYDADPNANPDNIYFTDQFLDLGTQLRSINSLVNMAVIKKIENGIVFGMERNTNMFAALLNQNVEKDSLVFKIGQDAFDYDDSKLNADSNALIASSSDYRGHVWLKDLAPDTDAVGQKLHILGAPFADGIMVGAVSTDTEAGNGVAAKDNLQNFFRTTFALPEGNNAVWCDGEMVFESATDCATLSFGKYDDAMNTTYSYHIEAGKGAQSHLKEKAIDDVKVDTDSDYTLTDASLEGPTNFAYTDPELIAYDDVLDVNFGKEAKMNVEVGIAGVTVTVIADELPTYDDAEFGGKPAKLALGMSIYPHSDGYSIGSLSHATNVVSDVGLNFIPTAQSDIETYRLPAISKHFDNVNFVALSRNLHNKSREALETLGTIVYQSKPGAVYGATGIASVGGDLTVENCTFDTYEASALIPQYAKDLIATSQLLHANKLSLAVGYANSTNDEYYVKVANNTINNAKAGIAVANAKTSVWDNNINLTTKAAWEDFSDMAADYLYSDKVQSDLPTATGDALRTDGQNPMAVHPQGVGIAVSAGGDQDYYAAGTDSVYDANGNMIKTDIEALELDKGHAITVLRNVVTTESGIGLAIGGEVDKSKSLCFMDSFDPAVDEACAIDSDVTIVVDDLTVQPTGNIPEDSDNEAYTRLDLVADGADVCLTSVFSGLEEQDIDVATSPKTIKLVDSEEVEVYDVPVTYISDVNCINSGAVVAGGSAGQYLRRITNTDAQYDAFAFGISGQNAVKRALSEAVIDNLGVNFAGFISLKDSIATGEGQMSYTITDNQIADSNGLDGVVSSKGFDNAVAIALDNHSLAQNSYYIIKDSTLNEVSLDVSGLETVGGTVDNVQYLLTDNVVDNNGAMAQVEYVNDENYYAQAVNAAEANTNPQEEGNYVSYFAKVKREGQLPKGPADSGVAVYAMDYSCTQGKQGWDIAGMISACTINSSDTTESVDDKWAYYKLTVPAGSIVMQAAEDYENLDSYGEPARAKSEVNYLEPINNDLSMVNAQSLVLTQATMKGKAHKGSQLWVFEPIEVLWESGTAIYPFVFESDSSWTVDLCLSVPTGYQIIEPEECVQTFVANEIKTINFVVQEVGTINTDSETDMTLVNPEGKKVKVKTKVQNRLGKKFIQEFLDANADELQAAGYSLDEKGRIKKNK